MSLRSRARLFWGICLEKGRRGGGEIEGEVHRVSVDRTRLSVGLKRRHVDFGLGMDVTLLRYRSECERGHISCETSRIYLICGGKALSDRRKVGTFECAMTRVSINDCEHVHRYDLSSEVPRYSLLARISGDPRIAHHRAVSSLLSSSSHSIRART